MTGDGTAKPSPEPDDAAAHAADQRLAEHLRQGGDLDALRAELVTGADENNEDLLQRLDALEFVDEAVGRAIELPTQLGAYAIKGLLGRGGMGTVYLGYQVELEREVALKVLLPSCTADPTMRKRFRAEARATAALHHRHIVPIYDFGEAQGMLYCAMERVDGMSLDKVIQQARVHGKVAMSPLEACRRFAGVADALGLAHRHRLLHRDVKPGNLLVAADGTLALTDFGLAKALDQEAARMTTDGGGFLGTLHYTAPEQAAGGLLSPASDLYALGATMFEAMTGELPHAAQTTEALLQAILHGTPKRLRDKVPTAPRDLDAVLEKLLSREGQDRYQDGEVLARDLQRIADGEPIHIRRLPLHQRALRRARRNPVLAGAVGTTLLLLVATMVLLLVLQREHGKGLVSRHQQNLVRVVQQIGNEVGDPAGQALAEVLTGFAAAPVAADASVLRAFAAVEREVRGDPAVAALRAAYLEDPLPEATRHLHNGAGYQALLLFDRAIVAAQEQGVSRDLPSEVRLYRLYLGRAVSKLTASVGMFGEARTDLALAAFLRPGAVFPQLLMTVLDLVQRPDPAAAMARFERDFGARPAAERLVLAQLLLTAAHLLPMRPADLMELSLAYPARRLMHDLAVKWGAVPRQEAEVLALPTGLEASMSGQMRAALATRGSPETFRTVQAQMLKLLDASIHPDAEMQSWRYVQRVLESPQASGPLLGESGEPLSPTMQLATWRRLTHLVPPADIATLWLKRFEQFRRAHVNLPGMARTAAEVHFMARSADAEQMLQAWVNTAEGDPAAHWLRMCWRLQVGQLDGALDDGMLAVQNCAERAAMVAEVVQACDRESVALAPALRAQALRMAEEFRLAMAPNGGGK